MRAGRMCMGAIPSPLSLTVRDWCSGAMARQESPCHGQAQEQYNVTQHIPLSEAKSRDLVFSIPPTMLETYITHGGLYGEITDVPCRKSHWLRRPDRLYWQQHFAGAGRIKQ